MITVVYNAKACIVTTLRKLMVLEGNNCCPGCAPAIQSLKYQETSPRHRRVALVLAGYSGQCSLEHIINSLCTLLWQEYIVHINQNLAEDWLRMSYILQKGHFS